MIVRIDRGIHFSVDECCVCDLGLLIQVGPLAIRDSSSWLLRVKLISLTHEASQ